jgi:hypothetical protein
MDVFAYVSLGALAAIVAVFVVVWLWDVLREPIGQVCAVSALFTAVVVCAVVGAVWLIGTKVI